VIIIIGNRMPLYEYVCESCGKRSSALLPRFDAPDPACPHCGGELRRLISTFATTRSREGGAESEEGSEGGEDGFGADDLGDDDW